MWTPIGHEQIKDPYDVSSSEPRLRVKGRLTGTLEPVQGSREMDPKGSPITLITLKSLTNSFYCKHFYGSWVPRLFTTNLNLKLKETEKKVKRGDPVERGGNEKVETMKGPRRRGRRKRGEKEVRKGQRRI